MTKILSFTDGSAYAASVYDHTAWAAERLQAQARVMHTLNPHREKAAMADLSGAIGVDAYQSLMNDIVAFDRERARIAQIKGEAILAEARRHLAALGLDRVETEQRHGLFVDVLDDLEEQIALIVIGKRGQSAAVEMKHLGTNIERTLRVAKSPVLVASRKLEPIGSFLLAFDGGPSSVKALEYALRSPLLQGLQCLLLRVGIENDRNREEMAEAAERLRKAGYAVSTMLEDGEPTKIIAREVEGRRIGLLVMGAYGHSRYKRLLIGSTTATLARECHVPILMFR